MNLILKILNNFDMVFYVLYIECSFFNVFWLWMVDVNSILVVGEEVNFYCFNDLFFFMVIVKCC